jgi:glc operon protein GlcG
MYSKLALSLEDAKLIAQAANSLAETEGWPVAIAVVDDGAQLLYFERRDGTKLGSIETAIAKARSAVLFARPTKALEEIIASGRTAMLRLPQAMPIQGGLPVEVDGEMIGAIGVSGVLSPQDEAVAHAGITRFAELK